MIPGFGDVKSWSFDLPPGPQDAIVTNEGWEVGIPDPKNGS